MKVTGIELLQKIKSGEVKNKTKIIEFKNDKANENLILDGTIQEERTHYELYNNHLFSDEYTYLIIEEPKEELEEIELIDIHYVNDKCIFKVYGQSIDETIAIKVNELIANQNKIVRELKEQR